MRHVRFFPYTKKLREQSDIYSASRVFPIQQSTSGFGFKAPYSYDEGTLIFFSYTDSCRDILSSRTIVTYGRNLSMKDNEFYFGIKTGGSRSTSETPSVIKHSIYAIDSISKQLGWKNTIPYTTKYKGFYIIHPDKRWVVYPPMYFLIMMIFKTCLYMRPGENLAGSILSHIKDFNSYLEFTNAYLNQTNRGNLGSDIGNTLFYADRIKLLINNLDDIFGENVSAKELWGANSGRGPYKGLLRLITNEYDDLKIRENFRKILKGVT